MESGQVLTMHPDDYERLQREVAEQRKTAPVRLNWVGVDFIWEGPVEDVRVDPNVEPGAWRFETKEQPT